MDRKPNNGGKNVISGSNTASAVAGGYTGHGKGSGGGKHKKQPVKVVYISNPMKVNASAAEFRAIVQELTGRDADPSKYADMSDAFSSAGSSSQFGIAKSAPAAPPAPSPEQLLGSAANSSVAGADHLSYNGNNVDRSAGYYPDYHEENEEDLTQHLIDNYSVFSPPAMLYDFQPKY